jgi:hypothetical protein
MADIIKSKQVLFGNDPWFKILCEIPELVKKLKDAISVAVSDESFLERINLTNSLTRERLDEVIEDDKIFVELKLIDCLTLLHHMERLVECERERTILEEGCKYFIEREHEVLKVYNSDGRRQEDRLRNVAKIMGLTNGTGKKKPKYDGKALFEEYMSLINGSIEWETYKVKEPMRKWDAVRYLKNKYEIQSEDACLKQLQREIAKRRKRAKREGFRGGFNGLLPSNWPDGKK